MPRKARKDSHDNENLKEKNIITNESIKLLFGESKNYKLQFKLIHNNYIDENFIDEEEEKENISCFIKKIEKKYNRTIEEINQDKNLLKKVVEEARKQTNATIVELSEILKVSKSTIGRYAKKS